MVFLLPSLEGRGRGWVDAWADIGGMEMERTPPELRRNARDLRNGATEAERVLWHALRTYRPRFTRQLVVGHFIIDIACRAAKVAVELDGGQHSERLQHDTRRTQWLEAEGWQVLRFWNPDVVANVDGVVAVILAAVSTRGGVEPYVGAARERRRGV